MSEVKKIATRDSYGNALVELGKEHERSYRAGRGSGRCYKEPVFSRKNFRSVIGTAVSQSAT